MDLSLTYGKYRQLSVGRSTLKMSNSSRCVNSVSVFHTCPLQMHENIIVEIAKVSSQENALFLVVFNACFRFFSFFFYIDVNKSIFVPV